MTACRPRSPLSKPRREEFDAAVADNPEARAYLEPLSEARLADLHEATHDEVWDANDLILL